MATSERECVVCKVKIGVRRYTLNVDGEPLGMEPDLCDGHGAAFLLGVGRLVGEMIRTGGLPRHSGNGPPSARLALAECFAEYCDDMGEGYDVETFIDFCVAQLIDPPAPPLQHRERDAEGFVRMGGLPEWYREHADSLERIAVEKAKPTN